MSAQTLALDFASEPEKEAAANASPVALLAELTRRGARIEASGNALAIDAPRGAVADLLPDLQRFKPALLELLTAPESSSAPAPPEPPATEPAPPFRTVAPFLLVPATIEAAPGAAKICATLQSFERVFAAARGGDLSVAALDVEVVGESHTLENAAAAVWELESVWSDRARKCQSERRDLTAPEVAALDAAAQLLGGVARLAKHRRAARHPATRPKPKPQNSAA